MSKISLKNILKKTFKKKTKPKIKKIKSINTNKVKKIKKVPERITMNSETKQKEIIERRYNEINLIFLFFIFI